MIFFLCIPISNVLSSAVISEFLGQAVVDEEEFVAMSSNPHQEIIRLDISVNKVLVVYELNTSDHLVG